MKERILTGWDFKRFIYLAVGLTALVLGIVGQDWMVGIVGAYFSSMAIFAFGCAAGNCMNTSCAVPSLPKDRSSSSDEIDFEEVR